MLNKNQKIEVIVGAFMLIGLLCVTYLALSLGNIGLFERNYYEVHARFTSASGLREGTYVEAAGVRVGTVSRIIFDPEDYLAVVTLKIDDYVPIQEDAVASIRTAGIIGDKFIKITPGGAEEILTDGMEIYETEPSINLEELISKYVFESGDD